MPRTVVYQATTERLEVLSPEGVADRELLPEMSDERIRDLYRQMYRMREYDDKAIKLQRQGRMGTWPSLRGQEACQAGVALALGEEDFLVPAFREQGLMLMLGVPGEQIYQYWAGDERGSSFAEGIRSLPIAVPVGSQLTHGAGLGMAYKLKGSPAVAVTFAGDGATSEGDFHEALNFAAVWKSQTVFVIQNNQWAISVPLSAQTASETIAQKAHAYGMPGLQVDGNDVFAVYAATIEALDRARTGGGPTLIECVTYRLGDHTTADDATRYRSDEQVQPWLERDPLLRLRRYMASRDLWDEHQEAVLAEEAKKWVDQMVANLEGFEPPQPSEMFEHMYAEMPAHLETQLAELLEEVDS